MEVANPIEQHVAWCKLAHDYIKIVVQVHSQHFLHRHGE
nr:MAG TPA: hypothetical protein [Caudoviricetes sp.]